MDSVSKKMISVVFVLVMVCSSAAVCVISAADDSQAASTTTTTYSPGSKTVFTGHTIGQNSYTNPVFDITYNDLNGAGYDYGSTFDVTVDGVTIHDAILSTGFMGTFMFDTYLNVETSGYVAAGAMWANILDNTDGKEVTITYTGTNTNYLKLDNFLTTYTDNRADYSSDAVFANFYEVTGGNIQSGKLYRSFTPFNDSATRSAYVNQMAAKVGINYDVALSYTQAKIDALIAGTGTGYCYDLLRSGSYTTDDISYKYFDASMKETLKTLLTDMSKNDGPYLLHCNVGRDRTGFFSTLLQALCGADAETMQETAAQAYVNLYHVVPYSKEYKVIVDSTYGRNMYYIVNYGDIATDLPDKMPFDWSTRDVSDVDTQKAAYDFCTGYLGMSSSTVDKLITNLCGSQPEKSSNSTADLVITAVVVALIVIATGVYVYYTNRSVSKN